MRNTKRWYNAFIIFLDLACIVLWIYLLILCFVNGSNLLTKLFLILMELIGIFNMYKDCKFLVKAKGSIKQ